MHLIPTLITATLGLSIVAFGVFFLYKDHKRAMAKIEKKHKESMELFSALGIQPSFTITIPNVQLPNVQFQQSQYQFTTTTTSIKMSHACSVLQALSELSAPKSMYVKHYLKYANDDPHWKEYFLTFCKDNNIDITENDIHNGELLK